MVRITGVPLEVELVDIFGMCIDHPVKAGETIGAAGAALAGLVLGGEDAAVQRKRSFMEGQVWLCRRFAMRSGANRVW